MQDQTSQPNVGERDSASLGDEWLKLLAPSILPFVATLCAPFLTAPKIGAWIGAVLGLTGVVMALAAWRWLRAGLQLRIVAAIGIITAILGGWTFHEGMTAPITDAGAAPRTLSSIPVLGLPGYVGWQLHRLDGDEAVRQGMGRSSLGVLVVGIIPGSPAAKAGMAAKDIVTRYNGRVVADVGKLTALVHDSAPGSSASVEVSREGELHTVTIEIGRL